jgi:hypothetical protein
MLIRLFPFCLLIALGACKSMILCKNMSLSWIIDRHIVHFSAVFPGQRWIAVGFNDQPNDMVGLAANANAVIFKPLERTVAQYSILGYVGSNISLHPTPYTGNFTFFQNSSHTMMGFSRGFWNGNNSDVQFSFSDDTIVMCAVGNTNAFNGTDAPDLMDSVAINFGHWGLSQLCSSLISFVWVPDGKFIHVLAHLNDSKWFAVGFNDQDDMTGISVDATAIIVKPVERTVLQYNISDVSENWVFTVHNTTSTNNLAYIQANGWTSLSFSRGLNNGDDRDTIISLTSGTNVTCAVGNTNIFDINDPPDYMGCSLIFFGSKL